MKFSLITSRCKNEKTSYNQWSDYKNNQIFDLSIEQKDSREKLKEEWGAKKRDLFSIGHERIYQFVVEDKKKGGSLY